MLGQLRGWEWLIIIGLVLLLFGAKRLPDAARGLGRSLRIFKAETKAMHDDDAPATPAQTQALPEAATPPAASTAPAPAPAPSAQAERTES